jgi:hypothetical protein
MCKKNHFNQEQLLASHVTSLFLQDSFSTMVQFIYFNDGDEHLDYDDKKITS